MIVVAFVNQFADELANDLPNVASALFTTTLLADGGDTQCGLSGVDTSWTADWVWLTLPVLGVLMLSSYFVPTATRITLRPCNTCALDCQVCGGRWFRAGWLAGLRRLLVAISVTNLFSPGARPRPAACTCARSFARTHANEHHLTLPAPLAGFAALSVGNLHPVDWTTATALAGSIGILVFGHTITMLVAMAETFDLWAHMSMVDAITSNSLEFRRLRGRLMDTTIAAARKPKHQQSERSSMTTSMLNLGRHKSYGCCARSRELKAALRKLLRNEAGVCALAECHVGGVQLLYVRAAMAITIVCLLSHARTLEGVHT